MSSELCQFCNENPVKVKKYKICNPCYARWLRTGKTARSRRGVKRISNEKWREKLRVKKGDEFISDLNAVRKNPYISLSDLAKKHGLSRERIRQIYKKYFGSAYTYALLDKAEVKKEELSCEKDPRNKVLNFKKGTHVYHGAEIEKLFMEACEFVGLNVSPSCNTSSDLVVNGKKVEVKSARTSSKRSNGSDQEYFSYNVKKSELDTCDIIAAHHPALDVFYIIPNQWRGRNCKSIQIRSDSFPTRKSEYNNYIQYINRFDLLMSNGQR